MSDEEIEFLRESNAIEGEYDALALADAISAWEYAKAVSVPDRHCILGIHEKLMKRLRPDIAGIRRQVAVMIGGKELPNPGSVNRLWIMWEDNHSNAKTEEEIKQAHIAFEQVHPFEDGNGRVGRIVMNMQRLNHDLPILVIHEGEEQQEYYKWFL